MGAPAGLSGSPLHLFTSSPFHLFTCLFTFSPLHLFTLHAQHSRPPQRHRAETLRIAPHAPGGGGALFRAQGFVQIQNHLRHLLFVAHGAAAIGLICTLAWRSEHFRQRSAQRGLIACAAHELQKFGLPPLALGQS